MDFFFPFEVRQPPRPCRCGRTSESHCTEVGIHNHRYFPPFCQLPDYHDLDEDFYCEFQAFAYQPARHWALVAEILQDRSDWIRPRVWVRTIYGEEFLVNFHLEDRQSPAYFTWDKLKPGNTLFVLYANRKQFLDLQEGIRQEASTTAMVFPGSLEQVMDEYDLLNNVSKNQLKECFHCKKAVEAMKRCAKCRLAHYCSRDCQVADWKTKHKKFCGTEAQLNKIVETDLEQFEDFLDWAKPQRIHDDSEPLQSLNTPNPVSTFDTLVSFLDLVGKRALLSDPVAKRVIAVQCPMRIMKATSEEHSWYLPLEQTKLFQALATAAKTALRSSQNREYTVTDFEARTMEDSLMHDVNLSALMFTLPQWQTDLDISGIIWCFQNDGVQAFTHHAFTKSDKWDCELADPETGTFMFKSHKTQVLCESDPGTVAFFAKAKAAQNPDATVVRVLKAYGPIAEKVAAIAENDNLSSDNMVTVWIRQDYSFFRYRRPCRKHLSLATQLTDHLELEDFVDNQIRVSPSTPM